MSLNIFPPILESSQPAFNTSIYTYPIYFTLSNITSLNTLGHIQIRLVYQKDNKSAVDLSKYPDGIIYKNISNIAMKGKQYYININNTDLSLGKWQDGVYYKVQLRFGKDPIWNDLSNFSNWKEEQIKLGNFSDWSTVMILKSIPKPEIIILNNTILNTAGLADNVSSVETSLTPIFKGKYSNTIYEPVYKYKFDLYSKDNYLLESSNWKVHNLSEDIYNDETSYTNIDSYRFNLVLTNLEEYYVIFSIETINGYTDSSEQYHFTAYTNYLSQLEKISIICKDNLLGDYPISDEEGVIDIYLSSDNPISGNFAIIRSDEFSNYNIWEDIAHLSFSNKVFDNELIFRDYTIESGIKYKYAFQQENSIGLRTTPLMEEDKKYHISNFEYTYLYEQGYQIKIKYDNKVNNFKHTQLISKQDTLGGKYPTILKNGDAYYAEFSINGLITFNMDDKQTFLSETDDGYFYNGQLVIPKDKYALDISQNQQEIKLNTYNQNLTPNNVFIERKFREIVESFLNNNNPKLYKSATEGNMIVNLLNVTLSPKQELGRIIYSFSANAYEIIDYTLDNLKEYNILPLKEFSVELSDENTLLLGQISGLYQGQYSKDSNGRFTIITVPQNLIDIIASENSYDIGGGFQYNFQFLKSIWIEQYPKINLTNDLNQLEAELINAISDNNTQLISTLNEKIEYLKSLQKEINYNGTFPHVTLILNGQEISLGLNRVYHLESLNLTTADNLYLKYSGAILLNYICEVNSIERAETTISAVASTTVWNQIEGIFTETTNILNNYNFYRENHLDISENYNIGLYQTLNILKAIKEKSKEEVEKKYNTLFNNYNEETDEWDNGSIFYQFGSLLTLEIEGNPGVEFNIIHMKNQTPIKMRIGPSGKIILKPMDEDIIKDIYLEFPSYLIINFVAITTQTIKGSSQEGAITNVGLFKR